MRKSSRWAYIRNIILLTIDCLRYDAITPEITPNLCKLAKEGKFYTNCWSEFGHTLASFQTLFESEWIYKLKEKGYYTIGINYNAYLSKGWGYEEGFDLWHDVTCRDDLHFIDNSTEIVNKLFTWALTEPFFLWLHFMDAHAPYYPHKWDNEMRLVDCGVTMIKPTKKIAKNLREKYNYAVSHIDRNIARIISFCKKWNIYKDTVFIVSSDHGEEFFEHGKFGHDVQRTSKEILHIPLIVKGNGVGIEKRKTYFKDISTIILNT